MSEIQTRSWFSKYWVPSKNHWLQSDLMLPFLMFLISKVFVTFLELSCSVKFYVYMLENWEHGIEKRKVHTMTDCFLVRSHLYKLTVLFMPSRRSTSPGIRRHCYFSASKNTKLFKKAGSSLSKILVFPDLLWLLPVSFVHWYRLPKTWSLVQTQCFSFSHPGMRIAKWWTRICCLKVLSLVVWKI